MTQAQLRLARPEDLPAAVQLYQRTRDQMLTRNNLGPPGEDPAAAQEGFRHVLETGIFYLAEMEEGLAGICHAVVRDQIWFLSGFWVAESLQRQGIGGPLLRKVWAEGEARGATIFCVWSSVDPTAMAFYMKLGMLPGTQILNFGGDSLALPPKPDGYTTRPLDPADAAAIDSEVRGTPRPVDHRWWACRPDRTGWLVLRGETPCGYFYLTRQGEVTPAAWLHPSDGEAVLTLACREAQESAGRAALRLLGCNHLGIRFAFRVGMRFRGNSHFLTTGPFGRLEQYALSGPLLL